MLGELSTCDNVDTFNLRILVCCDSYLSYFYFNLFDTLSPCFVLVCSKTICMAGMYWPVHLDTQPFDFAFVLTGIASIVEAMPRVTLTF